MEEKIVELLVRFCEDEVVGEDRDLDLFEEDLLDSLAFAELLYAFEEELGVIIAPSEVAREDINTTNKIIKVVMERANQ